MRTLFISDLHLEEDETAITQGFLDFLEVQVKPSDRLFILGDFFNLWVGDDDHGAFIKAIIDALRKASDHGAEIFLMHGNRDFLLGESFAEHSACQLIEEPYEITLGNKKAVLMHGDVLCQSDTEYQAFRSMVRDKTWQQTFLDKSLAERHAIGQDLRNKSQSMSAVKAEDIMDVTGSAVLDVFSKHDCDLLIHGHTHRPDRHMLSIGEKAVERIVLGAWHDKAWVLIHSETELTLKSITY